MDGIDQKDPNGEERTGLPKGYVVRDRETVDRILAVEAELLRSEGIDPAWPGFPDDQPADKKSAPRG